MRFTNTAFFATIMAAAAVSATPTTSAAITNPTQICLNACPINDNLSTCQAKCVGTPAPNSADTEATRKCVAKCPQGDGSPQATQMYFDCMNSCVKAHYFTSGLQTPVPATNMPTSVISEPLTTTSGSATGSAPTTTGGSNGGGSNGGSSSTKGGSGGMTTTTKKMGGMPTSHTNSSSGSPSGPGSTSTNSDSGAFGANVPAGVVSIAGLFLAIFAL